MNENPYSGEALDADELMNFADRIEALPLAEAEWVSRLFQECLRARMHEAELLSGVSTISAEGGDMSADAPLSDDQLAQVALDAAEWLKTLWNVGYMGAGSFPAQPRSAFPLVELEDVLKSALFARIREGKRPLPFPPPTRQGLPWHDLFEFGEAAHAVEASIVRDEAGKILGVTIEGCIDWRVLETQSSAAQFIVQHRGQGPLFRLSLGSPQSSLQRQAPSHSCRIVFQSRGGFRSYTLEWPQTDGAIQKVALRAATWARAESEAEHWIATHHPAQYGQVAFERVEP